MANALVNGNFELQTTGWFFYSDTTGSFSTELSGSSNIGKVTIGKAGTNVQLSQQNITLEPNTDYTLSFKAYSRFGNNLLVKLFQNVSPYTVYGLETAVELENSWKPFTFTFKTANFSATISDARLMFWLAPYAVAGDIYYIDDIILDVSGSDVVPIPPPVWTFQWQKNGINIPGAISQSYTTPTITSADNGASFSCLANFDSSSFNTNVATILVATTTGSIPIPIPPVDTGSLVRIEAKIDILTTQVASLTTKVDALTVQVNTVNNTVNVINGKVDTLDTKVTKAITDIGSTLSRIETNMVKKNEFVKIVTQ